MRKDAIIELAVVATILVLEIATAAIAPVSATSATMDKMAMPIITKRVKTLKLRRGYTLEHAPIVRMFVKSAILFISID